MILLIMIFVLLIIIILMALVIFIIGTICTFQKAWKTPMVECYLVKLQALACNFIINNTPPWVFFTFSKMYKWYQMAQSVTFTVNFENIDPRHSAWRLGVKFRFFIYLDNLLVFLENAKTIVILIFFFFFFFFLWLF